MADILYIVIPCFNEEEVLTETTKRLTEKMRKMMELTQAGYFMLMMDRQTVLGIL